MALIAALATRLPTVQAAERPKAPTRTTRPAVPKRPAGKPWLVWDTVEFNWGRKLADDKKIVGTFTFRNEGDTDLELTRVAPGCGCTAVDGYDKVVAPGKQGKIKFQIDPRRIKNTAAKSIRVESNSPAHPLTILKMKGEVYHLVVIKPNARVYFNLLQPGRPAERVLDVTRGTKTPVEIRKVTSDNPMFVPELQTITQGEQYRIKVVATPPYRMGRNVGTLTVTTNLEAQPTITLPVSGIVQPRLRISPSSIALNPSATWKYDRFISVINTGKTPIKVEKVTTSDPAIKALLTTVGRRGYQRVRVMIPENYKIPKSGSVLTLYTNDAEYETVEVPIVPYTGRVLKRPKGSKIGAAAYAGARWQPVGPTSRKTHPERPSKSAAPSAKSASSGARDASKKDVK